MSDTEKDVTFEEALEQLEMIVATLESGNLTLEESLALFEQGQILAKQCANQLDEAALRVEQLTADGEIVEL